MKNENRVRFIVGILVILVLSLAACDSQPVPENVTGLKIVVTTTFIADVVGQVAGDVTEISVLLEPGQNPHSYQPTPMDMVNITQADVIFANGLGLEEFLDDLLNGSDTEAELIVVSEGIQLLDITAGDHSEESDHEGEDHDEGDHDEGDHDEGDHEHEMGLDPHVWFDPANLIIWTDNIVAALTKLDPDHGEFYQANGQAYLEQLTALDTWIEQEVDRIPESDRKLVTDHTSLGYFARRYGFEQVGAVIPALTTEAETSGQELAGLIDTIRDTQVKAIFVGIDFDPTLAQRVADETGVELVPLYFGSLSEGDPAGTYLDFMRFDVQAIVNALQ